jgi:hypothetical protein
MPQRTHRVAVLTASLLAAAAVAPAMAQQVGTATAVNPLSQSAAPSGGLTTLSVGAHVVHKERIETTSSGTVQLLFLDKSTLSVGPNSKIVIDEFVYNPADGSGRMTTTLSLGTMRFVGGGVSHQDGATVRTPFAVIGIRGGTMTVTHNGKGTRVADHYGTVTVQNGCGTKTMSRSGFAVTVLGWTICPSDPMRVTEAEIAQYIQTLTSSSSQNGGVFGLTNVPVGAIGGGTDPGWANPGQGGTDASELIFQATHNGSGRTPPPPPPPPPITFD